MLIFLALFYVCIQSIVPSQSILNEERNKENPFQASFVQNNNINGVKEDLLEKNIQFYSNSANVQVLERNFIRQNDIQKKQQKTLLKKKGLSLANTFVWTE